MTAPQRTAYGLQSINPFCNFRVSRKGNCQEPKGDALRTRVQACPVPPCAACTISHRIEASANPENEKGQGRALAFGRRLNGGGLTPGLVRMALVRVRRGVIVVLVRTIRMRLVWMRRIGRRMVRSVLRLVRPSVGSFRRGR